jgi:hypothetical protein
MLHLFNKVYIDFDDKIEVNNDRVVVSEQAGFQMGTELDFAAKGTLISYGTSWDQVLDGKRMIEFLIEIKQFGESNKKKIVIYCDKKSYKEAVAVWFRMILPNLDLDGFKKLMDITIYKERIVSNTQLGSTSSLNLNQLWTGLDDLDDYWYAAADKVDGQDQSNVKFLEFKLSYEYLLADYFSGSDNYVDQLRYTNHLFLKRFFQEVFTDNRQMCLLNITNHSFQQAMEIDPSTVDITKENPLDGVNSMEFYADDEIWDKTTNLSSGVYGICNLDGLSQEKVIGLRATILNVFDKYEGMQIDRNVFTLFRFLELATKESITREEMDLVLSSVIANPFDTCLVPRFDFENVNFPLMMHFINLKKDNDVSELSKYALF